jgi:hypothetical protein
MITIRSSTDLNRARLPTDLHTYTSKLLNNLLSVHGPGYSPDEDGYIVVVTPTDTDASLSEQLGSRWQESLLEGISYNKDTVTWHIVYLHNNQYTMSVIVTDAAWLDPAIRKRIEQYMAR